MAPKRGMFRKDRVYQSLSKDMEERAMAGMYAMHGFMMDREARRKRRKR